MFSGIVNFKNSSVLEKSQKLILAFELGSFTTPLSNFKLFLFKFNDLEA